jgi:hypothetical protein
MKYESDIRLLRYYEAIHYTFEMLDYSYDNLYETCILIERDNCKFLDAISKCWTFIDSVNRLRDIAQTVPGLNTKNLNRKKFLEETASTKDIRNYIQHINQELGKRIVHKFPVYGNLSWVNQDNTCSIILVGADFPGNQYEGCVYDTHEKKWVSKVTLSVNGIAFHFDNIFHESIKFKDFILGFLSERYTPGIKLKTRLEILKYEVIIK